MESIFYFMFGIKQSIAFITLELVSVWFLSELQLFYISSVICWIFDSVEQEWVFHKQSFNTSDLRMHFRFFWLLVSLRSCLLWRQVNSNSDHVEQSLVNSSTTFAQERPYLRKQERSAISYTSVSWEKWSQRAWERRLWKIWESREFAVSYTETKSPKGKWMSKRSYDRKMSF